LACCNGQGIKRADGLIKLPDLFAVLDLDSKIARFVPDLDYAHGQHPPMPLNQFADRSVRANQMSFTKTPLGQLTNYMRCHLARQRFMLRRVGRGFSRWCLTSLESTLERLSPSPQDRSHERNEPGSKRLAWRKPGARKALGVFPFPSARNWLSIQAQVFAKISVALVATSRPPCGARAKRPDCAAYCSRNPCSRRRLGRQAQSRSWRSSFRSIDALRGQLR